MILLGDCLAKLAEMEENSVDAIVTDPPYGLSKQPDIAEVLTHWLAGDAGGLRAVNARVLFRMHGVRSFRAPASIEMGRYPFILCHPLLSYGNS